MCVYTSIYILTFYFDLEYSWLANYFVIISDEQQRDSAICIHVSILPQALLPSRLPHNIKQSDLWHTVFPCWLFILNIAVCAYPSQSP